MKPKKPTKPGRYFYKGRQVTVLEGGIQGLTFTVPKILPGDWGLREMRVADTEWYDWYKEEGEEE